MARKATRRAHNTGAVYYSESHRRWEGSISLGYIDGKRKRLYRTGKTQREVIDKLDALRSQMHAGTYRPDQLPHLSDYLRQWLADNGESRWRPKTRQAYTDAVARIAPALGHYRLDQLHNQHVEAFLRDLAKTYSRNTITNTRGVLRVALNDAIRHDLITRNAAKEARSPKHVEKETTEANPLTREELVRFLDAVQGTPFGDLFTVTVMIGLRMGEVRGLRWRDVSLPRATIRVTHQLQKIDNQEQLVEPKSKKSKRTIPLPPDVVEALRHRRKVQLEDKALAGDRWVDGDYVFSTIIGTPIDDSKIRKALNQVLDDAGIDHRRFHDLRHTCGTFLASTGVQPKELQRILGHESFATTMDIYVHADGSSVEVAMQAWSQLREVA